FLKQDRWEKDGQKFSKVTITANNVQLLGGRDGGSGMGSNNAGYSNNSYAGGAPAFQPNSQPAAPSYSGGYDSGNSFGGTGSDFPEDIPF
ncbi:MAG: single-stranded DNA-binding protein, partial [Treponema sp.]|nr:single-stranded DNA-binding protein [Treponema sp.]